MKYSVFILLLITLSFSIYSDNQTVNNDPSELQQERKNKQRDEYLKIIKLFQTLKQYRFKHGDNNLLKDKKIKGIEKEIESLNIKLKGASLALSNAIAESVERKKDSGKNLNKKTNEFIIEYDANERANRDISDYNGTGMSSDEILDIVDMIDHIEIKIVKTIQSEQEAIDIKIGEPYLVSGKIDKIRISDAGRSINHYGIYLYIK
ncbi:hypothetical protein LEP1GSC111_1225 [Leptospira interrogans str. UT126]|uniref:hypothetical protein n=1 Tax=Leptospira interrogans TaxID=173 RepID=UPI0002BE049D|nr:hypothetical protein [Leptospira interrogans]EMJ56525.1 hypothetical protein LEP1GSC111_1225 [Leptospira interrogans str. UT126]